MNVKRKGKNKKLWLCLAIASLPIIFMAGFLARGIYDNNRYKEFLIDYDKSIAYAIENDSLKAVLYGEKTRLTSENAYYIYHMILDEGFYYYNEDIPETEQELYLNFGNGDEIWIYAYEDTDDPTNLIMRYIKSGSGEYTCMTRELFYFYYVERLVSVEYGNELWDGGS